MIRFVAAFCAVFMFSHLAVAEAPTSYDPPIKGDMVKLVPYNPPVAVPQIVLSSATKGLTYTSEFGGKILLLNLWATWCPPCVKELPSLNALQYALGGSSLQVVPVSIDEASTPDSIEKYMQDNNLDKLTPYMDINKALPKLSVLKGVPGIPVTLIIDPQGRAIARVEGDVDWNGPDARAVIEYYMKAVSYSLTY